MGAVLLFFYNLFYCKAILNTCTIDFSSYEITAYFNVTLTATQTYTSISSEVTIIKASGDQNIEIQGDLTGVFSDTNQLELNIFFTSPGNISLNVTCNDLAYFYNFTVYQEILIIQNPTLVIFYLAKWYSHGFWYICSDWKNFRKHRNNK